MPKGRDPCVKPQTLNQDRLDVIDRDRLLVKIEGTFCDDDDRFALANSAVLERRLSTRQGTGKMTERTRLITAHISSSHETAMGGRSGMKTKSAPPLKRQDRMRIRDRVAGTNTA